jgi:hypothetical protein
MHSGQLTREQIKTLFERLHPTLDYVAKLEQRMIDRGFSDGDRLLQEVRASRLNLQMLCEHLHRMWCGPGFGG